MRHWAQSLFETRPVTGSAEVTTLWSKVEGFARGVASLAKRRKVHSSSSLHRDSHDDAEQQAAVNTGSKSENHRVTSSLTTASSGCASLLAARAAGAGSVLPWKEVENNSSGCLHSYVGNNVTDDVDFAQTKSSHKQQLAALDLTQVSIM